jgi:6-pyruvoyltetrahydropterin/6-carboxytetrahydropterin synthase
MPLVRVTRRYRFSAAHRLDTPLLGPERNREVYGKCNNPHGHGHDYVVEVTISGELDSVAGRLAPLALLDRFAEEVLLKPFDRRNLNCEVPEFLTLVPTTENLAEVLARRLAAAWPVWFGDSGARFEKVRIWETPRNIFEVFAGGLQGGEIGSGESSSDEVIQSRG